MRQISEPLVITGWGVISPIGIGIEAFAAGLRAERSGRKPLTGYFEHALPFSEACVIPEFEATTFLGKKGTRFLDRTTTLAIATIGLALQHGGFNIGVENQERIGVVLGTNVGSVKSICDFMRDTLVHERPYMVNPMRFPNAVMNCAAGQSAIWHKMKGVNATISGGRMAGLLALRYASLMLRLDYVETVFTGGVEEFCEQTAWGFYHAGLLQPEGKTPLGEGCAMFALEKPQTAAAQGREALAEVLACEVGVYYADDDVSEQATGLAHCIRTALERAAVKPEDVWAVSSYQSAAPKLARVEEEGLRLALDGHEPAHRLAIDQLIGECFSAAGAFQLAALLASFDNSPGCGGRAALMTSVAHHGGVGCAVIREKREWLE